MQQRVLLGTNRMSKMADNDWMKDTRAAANDCETNTPWARGLKRQAMIADRLEAEGAQVKVSLPPMPAFMFTDITV